jgi:hypothetical protein
MNKIEKQNKDSANSSDEIREKGELYDKVAVIIEQTRQKAATSVNLTMVYAYYEIGRYIVEDEQRGEQRAEYGKAVLKELSTQLIKRFGKGFLFEARQKRFTFDEEHYFLDLVLYNRLLQSYILIDLKTKNLLTKTWDKCRCM